MTVVDWDEVEPQRIDLGHLRSTWTDLGLAAGSVGVRLRLVRIDAGAFSTPVHVHRDDEEIFFVLAGAGLSWQDGRTYRVAAGDCLVHLEGAEAHTLEAGEGGLVVLVFGAPRERASGAYLPRTGVVWSFPTWLEPAAGPTPFEREAALGPPELPDPGPRPGRIVNLADCEAGEVAHGDSRLVVRNLGAAAGSVRTGLRHHVVAPRKLGWPPHCHSAEEELLVVLEGEGTLLLGEEERAIELGRGVRRPAGLERIPLRAGHVVARPPATRIAHALLAGEAGLTYLAYGTREPNDVVYYPRSNKVYLRGIGVIARLERLEYWDGEP